jgi:hypothetical protein
MGLDVRPASLPGDVAQTVLSMWRAGERRAAYGMLYRATLVALMERHQVEFRQGDTEGECVRAVRGGADPNRAAYFSELTGHWQRLAYAHREPSDEVVEQLCADWSHLFAASVDIPADRGSRAAE